MSPLLPRKLSVQQGTSAAPVKTPAEDWRLNDGGLWTPSGTQLQERSGVIAGPGPSAGVEPLAVTAAAGGVFTIQPGRFLVQGSAALQGSYRGTIDQVTTRTIAGVDLPASGSFRAGYLGIKVYDQVYGDTQDGADVVYVVGASASTAAAAVYPALPTSFLQLRAFTVDSTGAVTMGAYLPPFTAPRGGINPARTTDATNGAYVGQYRDHPTQGLQRWNGVAWDQAMPGVWQALPLLNGASPLAPGTYRTPQYRVRGDRVELRGAIGTMPANGTACAQLPGGACPALSEIFPIVTDTAAGSLYLYSTGVLTRMLGSAAWLSISGISFSIVP